MAGVKQRVITVKSTIANSFIVCGERPIIVDTGMPGHEEKIFKAMDENGIKPADISLILITHGHNDHIGSAYALKQKTGAPVAIHRADSVSLKTGIGPRLAPIGLKGVIMRCLMGIMKASAIKGVDADILIENEMDLGKYGIAGKVIPTPGHTAGGLSLFLNGGCLLVGDLIFGGIIRQKAPGFPYLGDDKKEILRSIQKVMQLGPKIVYAGHGGPFPAREVRRKFLVSE